jgi:hypothetical protein
MMADDPQPGLAVFMRDEAKKWVARASFAGLTVAIVAAATPLGFKVKAIWNSPADLAAMDSKLDAIGDTLMRLTGDGRVTRQPDGMSYVREPVTVGLPIVLVLFIGRTDVGSACTLREIIPQFTDENDVQRSGVPRRPSRQLGPDVVRRELQLDPPGGMVAGRMRVQLQLEYVCGGDPIFELTKPVFYYATPA